MRLPKQPAEPRIAPFELSQNHWKTSKSSVPVLSAQKPWFSQGFSHFWPIALAFCAYPCMSMPAGAAPVEIIVLCAALAPKNISVSRASESPEYPVQHDAPVQA
jgi:hypothetical protein